MKKLLNLLFTAFLAVSMTNAVQAKHLSHNGGHEHHGITMKQAVRQVTKRNPNARILATKTIEKRNGKRVHVIKLITPKGKVRRVRIRAN